LLGERASDAKNRRKNDGDGDSRQSVHSRMGGLESARAG
jgi:hypothetical protein